MKIFSGTLIILAVIFLTIIGFGYSSPVEYIGVETREYDDSKNRVWESLTDIKSYPERKREVKNVELLERSGKIITKWRENTEFNGYRVYKLLERDVEDKLVLEMVDSGNTTTGIWTYTLRQKENKTEVTIKEESRQENIFWRGINAIGGRDSFIDHEFKWLQVALWERILY